MFIFLLKTFFKHLLIEPSTIIHSINITCLKHYELSLVWFAEGLLSPGSSLLVTETSRGVAVWQNYVFKLFIVWQ